MTYYNIHFRIVTPKSRIFYRDGIVTIAAANETEATSRARKHLGGNEDRGVLIDLIQRQPA